MDYNILETMDSNMIRMVLNEINLLINRVSFFDWKTITDSVFFYISLLYMVAIAVFFSRSGKPASPFYTNWPKDILGKCFVLGKWLLAMFIVPCILAAFAVYTYSYAEKEKASLVCNDLYFKHELILPYKRSKRPSILPKFNYASDEEMITSIQKSTDELKKPLVELIKTNIAIRPYVNHQKIIISAICQLKESLESKQSSNTNKNEIENFIKQLEK